MARSVRKKLQWFRNNPERRRIYNRRYYSKNAKALRARAAAVRAGQTEKEHERRERFRAEHPTYQREYRARRRLRDSWQKFANVCAINRSIVEKIAGDQCASAT